MLLDLESKTGAAFLPCRWAKRQRIAEASRRCARRLQARHGRIGALQRIEYRLSRVRSDDHGELASLKWAVMCRAYLRLKREAAEATVTSATGSMTSRDKAFPN